MTTTKTDTLGEVLTKADPNQIADALRKVDLGNMLQAKEYDTGTITAAASIDLPERALVVQSARIVTSGTAGSVGSYMCSDVNAVMAIPAGGANLTPGVARISADGKTITFPNTITRAIVRYIPAPETLLTAKFAS